MVYQMALQSELTFALLTFIGLLLMFWSVDPKDIVGSVKSKNIIPANVVFGISILARITGSFMLGFTGILFLKKIIA